MLKKTHWELLYTHMPINHDVACASTIKRLNDYLSFEKKDEAMVQSKQHDAVDRT